MSREGLFSWTKLPFSSCNQLDRSLPSMARAKPSMGRKDASPCFHRTFGTTQRRRISSLPVVLRDFYETSGIFHRRLRKYAMSEVEDVSGRSSLFEDFFGFRKDAFLWP